MLGPLPHFKNNLGMMGDDESPDTVGLLEWDGPGFEETIFLSVGYSPQGPATRRTASGLERPRTEATAFNQVGGARISLGSVGRRGKPHGSTRIRCLTLKEGKGEATFIWRYCSP